MRQWDEVEPNAGAFYPKFAANDSFETWARDKLGDGESANRDNELGLQDSDFFVHPERAIANFIRTWNAISAGSGLARETSADGGEVDAGPNSGLVQSTKALQPLKQGSAGGMRKWSSQHRLPWAGRLSHQHDLADQRTP